MQQTRVLAASALAATLIAGCGSSGSSGSGGLSKSQLAAKTNGVCRGLAAKIRAIKQPTDFTTNPSAAAAYLDKVSAVYHDAEKQLNGLTASSSTKPQWSAVTTRLSAVVKLVDDVTQKAHNKDRTGLTELQQLGPLTSSLNQATKAIGANCSSA